MSTSAYIYPGRWSDCGKATSPCCPTPLTWSPDLTTTTMDPVAAKSSFLCMYMSSHKDTLASYVIYHGKVANVKITNAEMTSIDSKVLLHSRSPRRPFHLIVLCAQGMSINYQTPSSGNEKISVRIEFEPPLSGYEEVKPRLLSMKADAEESLGMVRATAAAKFRLLTQFPRPLLHR